MGSIAVVVVDDHELVREGLASLLAQSDEIRVTGQAASVDRAVELVEAQSPDVVLLDMQLGSEQGLDVVRRLRAQGCPVPVLVLSAHDSARHLREALTAGADGYLLKSSSAQALVDGIRAAAAGQTVIGEEFVARLLEGVAEQLPEVTGRELEILELVAQGNGNREIAERLGISSRTAQKHLEHLFRKLEAGDRTELVALAFRAGLLG